MGLFCVDATRLAPNIFGGCRHGPIGGFLVLLLLLAIPAPLAGLIVDAGSTDINHGFEKFF